LRRRQPVPQRDLRHDEAQRRAADASRAALRSPAVQDPIVTPVVAAGEFWPAEDYHQDYYLKNPIRYSYYRNGCGRDRRLSSLWGDAAK
jgi:peptide-methionine (S)-S-oxide reductase